MLNVDGLIQDHEAAVVAEATVTLQDQEEVEVIHEAVVAVSLQGHEAEATQEVVAAATLHDQEAAVTHQDHDPAHARFRVHVLVLALLIK